jgi:hypothetical protein
VGAINETRRRPVWASAWNIPQALFWARLGTGFVTSITDQCSTDQWRLGWRQLTASEVHMRHAVDWVNRSRG